MSTVSGPARDTIKDAKDAAQKSVRGTSAASGDVQSDLEGLRLDVAKLTAQIGDIVASKGFAAWQRPKSRVGGAMTDAEAKGQEAVDSGDNIADAIDESLKRRPYTTLAVAVGIGFLFGATLRR